MQRQFLLLLIHYQLRLDHLRHTVKATIEDS